MHTLFQPVQPVQHRGAPDARRTSVDSLGSSPVVSGPPTPDRPRFLSEADCHEIIQRLARFSKGGGNTAVMIWSKWTGYVRWARNIVSNAGDVRNNVVGVARHLNGAIGAHWGNDITEPGLVAAARKAERIAALRWERPQSDLVTRLPLEPATTPQLFHDATYQLSADQRAAAAVALAKTAAEAGMLSAGYIAVSAYSMAKLDTLGRSRYCQWTHAQYSVTVRDPTGTGSGWAGLTDYDWSKIDTAALTELALSKCLTSRQPVAIEPGRYTTILEPQAVCDVIGQLVFGNWILTPPLGRGNNETKQQTSGPGPFYVKEGESMLGQKVFDERVTIRSDPMDPEVGFPPFEGPWVGGPDEFSEMPVYHPVTWIEHGILTNLGYGRNRGFELGVNTGLPIAGGFRMEGGPTSMAEMIASTKRGLLVTRCDVQATFAKSALMMRGITRDGLWLIENGKISKPVKNLVFTESILFMLNNLEQLGIPQRTFHLSNEQYALREIDGHPQPVIVPPLKIRDFSFTAVDDAV